MKRFWLVLILLLAGWIHPVQAQGPDDAYVQVYQQIQDADRMRANGQIAQARSAYVDAYDKLTRFKSTYPGWNDAVVQFRLNDLVDKLRTMPLDFGAPSSPVPMRGQPPARSGTPGAAIPSANLPGASPAPASSETETRIRSLTEQLQHLTDENALLQVKLTEALSARPAASDPQELRKAEQKILGLEKEKEVLTAALDKARSAPAAPTNTAALEEALKASRAELAKQVEMTSQLVHEKELLEIRLKDALRQAAEAKPPSAQAPSAPAPGVQPPAPNVRPAPPRTVTQTPAPPAAAPPAVAPPPAAPNPDQIIRLQSELAILRQEKQNLENSQKELQAKLEGKNGGSGSAATPSIARDEVIRQVNSASRDLAENQARADALEKELAALKGRVQVLESERVPYTPEELALFKVPMPSFGTTNRNRARAPREYAVRDQKLLEQARVEFNAQRYPEAEKSFIEILRSDSANVVIMNALATAQIEQNRYAEAEGTLTKALNLEPSSPDVLHLLGRLNFKQKKMDAALDYFSRAAQADPSDTETLNYLGVVLAEKGQRQAAETAIRRAIEVAPGNADAHYNLAVMYAEQKPTPFLELARWHYQKALALGHAESQELQKKIEQGADLK